jgi:hypothetical protein
MVPGLRLVVEDAESGMTAEQKEIAEHAIASTTPAQLHLALDAQKAAERIRQNRGKEAFLEAGILTAMGGKHPVIAMRRNGDVNAYLAGSTYSWSYVIPASDGDKYQQGPKVAVVSKPANKPQHL